ncbi:hypothetical protein B0J18DRAFT_411956 [Chaetomium sp. MPI-SDFR-AT-0129]|nr:hypothetical protein B0J18DRAFT_411956 [Chaetomium sp. MPI-SDFR-AT-0129]
MTADQEAKEFDILENNPEVMNALGEKLGLSKKLAFYDVLSLDEPELLAHIPRPAYALLAIIPLTKSWQRDREEEDARLGDPITYYDGGAAAAGGDRPLVWFQQTIREACGSYGFVHCAINGEAAKFLVPGSTLDKLRTAALPLAREERAKVLYDSEEFEEAHKSVVALGDTPEPIRGSTKHAGQHFVAYVKENGHLWELEGSRGGPLDRGTLAEDEDVLSPRALELSLKRILTLNRDDPDVRFSCTVLAPAQP